MVLLLSRKDIESLVDMRDALKTIEDAFIQQHEGKTVCPKRSIIGVEEHSGLMYYMPSYLGESEALAIKIVAQYVSNLRKYALPTILASILLSDPRNGMPLALMEGTYLTALRTGAASGVATKYLARKDSESVGVIGTGVQARSQVWALREVLGNISRIKAYDTLHGRTETFAKETSKKLSLDVKIVQTSKECVKESDVLIVATTSKVPVLNGNWLRSGAHLNSIGVSGPEGRELDDATISRAKIVVDTLEGALAETGDLIIPINNGLISRNDIYAEMHEIVSGKKTGRVSDSEITCWKAVGVAIEDAAIARLVYDKARKQGVGKEVDLCTNLVQ